MAQRIASTVEIEEDVHFLAARRAVREALNASGASTKVNNLVGELLGNRVFSRAHEALAPCLGRLSKRAISFSLGSAEIC